MPRIAFATIGRLRAPVGDAIVQGFIDRVPATYDQAGHSPGFIDRSRRDIETWTQSWGEVVSPKCYDCDPELLAATLSMWQDLESVAAYAYRGHHAEALANRRDWFEADDLPTYVAWWIADGEEPSFAQAAEKFDYLHEHGPTPEAFNFRTAFAPDGSPYQLNSALVKEKAALAATR
ncbi:MAG: DUF3291 domain-containing protein [Armatimonadetes bacterium]|nr:DUF3291 domain-containing protein [Armatimonadota bacterium]